MKIEKLRQRSERGAAMVEYALLLALIAVVAIGSLSLFGESLGGEIEGFGSKIDSASQP